MIRSVALSDPDADLVHRMAKGDEEALQDLYAKYAKRLYAYALRLSDNQSVAEEVLQDSLLAAWKGARGFRGEARVLTWLLGIVHHQALNATRRKQLATVELDRAVELADPANNPADQADNLDLRRVLALGLQQLSAQHRAVLTLVFYYGLGLAEVAQVCACPVGTVKSRLSYAKTYLREALGKAGLQAEELL